MGAGLEAGEGGGGGKGGGGPPGGAGQKKGKGGVVASLEKWQGPCLGLLFLITEGVGGMEGRLN